jgi:polar amino acid transport system substrate-binding protein
MLDAKVLPYVRIRLVLSLLGLWLTCVAGPAAAAGITLCADVWCPYNCIPGSEHPGFAVDIAHEVFTAAGYTVEYQAEGWSRCVEDARAGRYTAIIGAIPSDAPDFIYPAEAIGISTDGYAVRKGDQFQFTGEQALDGRVLGLVRSYSFSGPIGAYIAAHANDASRVQYVSGNGALAKNLGKLLAGRIDVVLDDGNVLRNAIADMGLEDRVTLAAADHPTPVFIAFSPAAPQGRALAQILDRGIARLRASGKLAQIMASYHLSNGS